MKPVVVHTGAGRMVSSCGRPSAVLLLTAALAGCSGGGANSDAGGGSASLAGGGTASMAGGGGSTSVGGGGGTVETDGGSGGMLQVDVSGLDGMLYLTLDGTEEIAIDADGVSAFSRTLGQGAAYALEVTGHPLAQFCAIDAATGTFDAGAEPISVRCEAGFAAVSIFEEYEEDGSVARRQQTTYDEATGQRTSSRSATGPGDDGVWFNADDEGLAWTLFTYEGEELSERRTIEGLGDDGVAGTDDDDITFLAEYPVEDGEQIGYLEYDGPGDDGDWFTGDETITSSSYRFENVSVDDQGRPTCRVQRRPGVDLAFDTADDEFSDIRGYEYQRIEPQGFDLTLETTFDEDAGGNGIPCEEGDPTRLLSERYVDDQGRLAYSTNFASRYYRNLYDETGARVGDERGHLDRPLEAPSGFNLPRGPASRCAGSAPRPRPGRPAAAR